jgi:hypothetical protein
MQLKKLCEDNFLFIEHLNIFIMLWLGQVEKMLLRNLCKDINHVFIASLKEKLTPFC